VLTEFLHGELAMPVYRELGLESLALYQQGLRTAERVKTLRREIDDINRELYERLDDLDIIIEKFRTTRLGVRKDPEKSRLEIKAFDDIGAVDDEIRNIVARNWPHLLSNLPPEEG
jgi:hypothetical protein